MYQRQHTPTIRVNDDELVKSATNVTFTFFYLSYVSSSEAESAEATATAASKSISEVTSEAES